MASTPLVPGAAALCASRAAPGPAGITFAVGRLCGITGTPWNAGARRRRELRELLLQLHPR